MMKMILNGPAGNRTRDSSVLGYSQVMDLTLTCKGGVLLLDYRPYLISEPVLFKFF